MRSFTLEPLIGTVCATLVILNTILWVSLSYGVAIAKIFPHAGWRTACTRWLMVLGNRWIAGNKAVMAIHRQTTLEVEGFEGLEPEAWYLVNSNHRSWADIPVLQYAFHGRTPFLKFFLKRELIWVPLLGLAWWALDFPFLRRYPKHVLEKNPELREHDRIATIQACERFSVMPVTILNFLEGTRFSEAKRTRQESPYQHLLRPKVGGIALVIDAMGPQLRSFVDVTIAYPGAGDFTFWDYLCGRVPRIIVRAQERKIPADLLGGDYSQDPAQRGRLRAWLEAIWLEKDALLEKLNAEP